MNPRLKMFSTLIPVILFLSSYVYAVEPPLIVEQAEETFAEPGETQTGMPDQDSLSISRQQGQIQVDSVQFQGGSVFELSELLEEVKPIIGETVTKLELVKVLRSITAMYQDAGYALSFAFLPKQSRQNGQVTIVLVEGFIADSNIKIEDEQVRARISRLVAKMQSEKPLKLATFERYLKLIEATPGYSLKVSVPKPKKLDGGTTIRVEEVKREPYEFTMGLDDSKAEEPRILGGVTINSLTSNGDKLTLSGLVPNDTIDQYYAIKYQQDIGGDGLKLALTASQFESQGDDRIFVSDVPINYEENKERESFSVGLSYPLLLDKKTDWWIGTKLHHRDEEAFYELSRQDGAGDTVGIEKELRYSAIEFNTRLQNKTPRQVIYFNASIKQGIELGSNKNQFNDDTGQRPGAESTHFNLLDVSLAWRYLLSPRWRVQTRANLFWSDDILPSAEQVRFGGKRYGRGYPDGQAQGDQGYAAELELRYLQPLPGEVFKRIEPYLLLDVARAELKSNENKYKLSSAVIGLDVTDAKHYSLGFEYAKPLGDEHFETQDRSPIYNIRASWNF